MAGENEKALIVLGEKHIKLVEKLKKSLLVGQLGFLKAAEFLHTIKSEATYIGEDLAHPWTWQDFCSRPDLPIPGRTPESRRRTADALVRIHETFIQRLKYPQDDIAEIGWTKLDLIAPLCTDKKAATGWIDNARLLTAGNLIAEIRGKDEETFANMSCKHEDQVREYRCKGCGARSKDKLI
jgi:hypothetical protein